PRTDRAGPRCRQAAPTGSPAMRPRRWRSPARRSRPAWLACRCPAGSLVPCSLGALAVLVHRLQRLLALGFEVLDQLLDTYLLDLGIDLVALVGDVGDALDDHVVGLPVAAAALAEGVVDRHQLAVVQHHLRAHHGALVVEV